MIEPSVVDGTIDASSASVGVQFVGTPLDEAEYISVSEYGGGGIRSIVSRASPYGLSFPMYYKLILQLSCCKECLRRRNHETHKTCTQGVF